MTQFSLSKSHSEFLWDSCATDYDKTLNNLIYLLGTAESAMIWKASKANLIRRSTSQNFMDIDNGETGNPEKAFSSQEKGLTIVNQVDQMVKRKRLSL